MLGGQAPGSREPGCAQAQEAGARAVRGVSVFWVGNGSRCSAALQAALRHQALAWRAVCLLEKLWGPLGADGYTGSPRRAVQTIKSRKMQDANGLR